jgi:hypothetical protein
MLIFRNLLLTDEGTTILTFYRKNEEFKTLRWMQILFEDTKVKIVFGARGDFRAKTTRFRSATLPYLTLPLKYTN